MRNLLTDPLFRPKDLGLPIPDSLHATSVCMPRWEDNVDYEKQAPRVMDKLQSGYPRFVYPSLCNQFFQCAQARWGMEHEECLALSSKQSAIWAGQYIKAHGGGEVRIKHTGAYGVHMIFYAKKDRGLAKQFWQHTGLGISSRLALACLDNAPRSFEKEKEAKGLIKEKIALHTESAPEDIYLFPTGMTAFFFTHRILSIYRKNSKSIQFGFPYVDSYKIQDRFGGSYLFSRALSGDCPGLLRLVKEEKVMGLFCEAPGNPQFITPNLKRLTELSLAHDFPLVIDDTIGTFYNLNLMDHADLLITSLTKFFSGVGDVMGGSIVLNPRRPWYRRIKELMEEFYEDLFWVEDALVLEKNCRDFEKRMPVINDNTLKVVNHLEKNENIEAVYYPRNCKEKYYDQFLKTGGGYSGMFSIILKERDKAPLFFDSLSICKGPSLGLNFSIACPYTILAHFGELDWADSYGIKSHLIRFSIGLEDPEDLIERFDRSLQIISK